MRSISYFVTKPAKLEAVKVSNQTHLEDESASLQM